MRDSADLKFCADRIATSDDGEFAVCLGSLWWFVVDLFACMHGGVEGSSC